MLADYRQRFPNIAISVHDVLASQVDDLVSDQRADIGLSVQPLLAEATHFESLVEDYFVAVCPVGHPLLTLDTIPWEALLHYPIIGLSRLSSTRAAIESVLSELSLEMDLMCEVSQIGTAGRMVAAGLGVAALPSLSFRQISAEGIEWRPLIDPYVPRSLGIITPSRVSPSAAATTMLETIRAHAGQLGGISTHEH